MAVREIDVRYAKPREKAYKLSLGGGLHVLVQPSGSKLWRMKYRFDGKEKLLSFGPYPTVSLSAAREMQIQAKHALSSGLDPMVERRRRKRREGETFEQIARTWHSRREASLDPAHAARVLSRMERDVFPIIGQARISDIKPSDVLDVVREVELRGAIDVSRRLKQGISQVFRFAVASDLVEHDPTVNLRGALMPKPRVRHMPRVPLSEFPRLIKSIRNYDGEQAPRRREVTRNALMFTLLTWTRTSEVRFAEWTEFEGIDEVADDVLWRISPERMKMDREHLVPLPRQAVAMLRAQRAAGSSTFVFEGERAGQPISTNTMIYACYRMGYRRRQTVHGFRGLASTWANETGTYHPDWIEMALSHVEDDEVRNAYNSALYLKPRRKMLQDWADYIDQLGIDSALGGTETALDQSQEFNSPLLQDSSSNWDTKWGCEVGRFSKNFEISIH
ncbi:MAG: integrase arm-type DNA-binding domain-containing protein [Pseudomonadota bacterium]